MSEANCGISVHEVTQVRVSDSEGNAMNQGDTIILRIDTEDILCLFKGIESGYFITETCGTESETATVSRASRNPK